MIFFTPNKQLNVVIERDLSLTNNLVGCCEHGLHQHLSYLLSTRRVSLTVTASSFSSSSLGKYSARDFTLGCVFEEPYVLETFIKILQN